MLLNNAQVWSIISAFGKSHVLKKLFLRTAIDRLVIDNVHNNDFAVFVFKI